jgi:alpha-1,3-rhamnosyl/mannosyltransferase
LHQRFQQAQAAGWLRYLGYTSAADLPFLFAGARSFLFPSLYEGFGLPVLEALASGVPVVCSDSSSLPEVVGDCGLMCRPLDVESLTLLIQKSIEDKIWREQAILNGLNRAKNFSWQRCAQETIHAYHQV